jgi:hypothetical protein
VEGTLFNLQKNSTFQVPVPVPVLLPVPGSMTAAYRGVAATPGELHGLKVDCLQPMCHYVLVCRYFDGPVFFLDRTHGHREVGRKGGREQGTEAGRK